MEAGPLGYTVALGLPELRARIARLYRDWYGVDLDPGRVVVTAGSSAGFILAFTSLFERGDRVAIGDPGYPSYRNILRALDLEPVGIADRRRGPLPAGAARPDAGPRRGAGGEPGQPDRHDAGPLRARGADRAGGGARHRLRLGRDLPRHPVRRAGAVSALEISDEVYVINSFSKYFSMTGWRIGWMVVPEAHVRRIERLVQNLFICAPHASQVAALAALDATDGARARTSPSTAPTGR